MKKSFRMLFISVAVLFMTAALTLGWFFWQTEYRRTPVVSFSDGQKELRVYQTGELDFPFGHTRGVLELLENGRKKDVLGFEVADDGANLQPENFLVSWHDEGVTVIICGSEQDPQTVELSVNEK
ncbi:MAG: hypothetical protein IJM79_03250 [Erysipelotrichaceae bacterium]|nr:hypothetical protein [Erysipelotrichaceae bacterium]